MIEVDFKNLTDRQLMEASEDSVRYCEHFLGEHVTVECAVDPLTPYEFANAPILQQRRIMRAFHDNQFVSVAGSNTFGKSHIMVRLGSWWIDKWDECMVIVIAPRMDQINKNFAMPFSALRGGFSEFADKDNTFVYLPDKDNPLKQVVYTTAAKQESIAGWHYWKNKLFLFDEASGIHKDIYDAVFPMAARRDSKWGLFGNPIRDEDEENYGRFKESSESPNWKFFSLSAFDHPNYIHKRYVIEKGMDPDWPEKAAIQYHGTDTMEYIARVLGRFAFETASSMYGLYLDKVIVKADEWLNNDYKYTTLGIDPAGKRSGDKTVINKYKHDRRKGESAETVYENERADEEAIKQAIIHECNSDDIDAISADARGLGYFLPAFLRECGDVDVDDDCIRDYDGVVTANDPERFDSKKDEDAFDLRDRMQESTIGASHRHTLKVKHDDTLYKELGTRKYTSKGLRLKLVEKKAGTGESPDHFEALLIARDAMKRHLAKRRFAPQPSSEVVITHNDLETLYD